MDSQNKTILKYLQKHKKGITSIEAFQKFDITRLSGRIHDLRAMGYSIETIDCMALKEDGRKVRYGRYVLKG